MLEQQLRWSGRRPGYKGVRADEFIEAGDDALVVGVYWIANDGSRADPFVFQLVTVSDGQIARVQDYRRKEQAARRA